MAKLIALQMVSAPDVEQNLQSVRQQLKQLKPGQEYLVVLPECFAFFGAGDARMFEIAEPRGQGYIQDALVEIAKEFGVWLVAGTIPILNQAKDKFTASCLLIDSSGQVVSEYQKIHLFDVQVADNTGSYLESRYTQAGGHLSVIDTPFGRLGLAVCYDVRFPGLFQAMGQVDILALPAAFTQVTGQAHWHHLLKARSIENQCYLVAADQGGTHINGRETYGHSLILSPWGETLAEIRQGEGLIQSEIDLSLIENIRQKMPVTGHNRFRSDFIEK